MNGEITTLAKDLEDKMQEAGSILALPVQKYINCWELSMAKSQHWERTSRTRRKEQLALLLSLLAWLIHVQKYKNWRRGVMALGRKQGVLQVLGRLQLNLLALLVQKCKNWRRGRCCREEARWPASLWAASIEYLRLAQFDRCKASGAHGALRIQSEIRRKGYSVYLLYNY